MTRSLLAMAAIALLIAGCGGKKAKDLDPPAELGEFESQVKIRKAWSSGIGGRGGGSIAFWKSNPSRKPEKLLLGLAPASDGGRIYAASHGGRVVAHDTVDGSRYWSVDTKLRLSGGPGVGEGLLVIGSIDGQVIALSTLDGEERWRTELNAEILSAPAIEDGVVVVRAVAGQLFGLSADDGSEIWMIRESVPALTLRGTSNPLFANELAWCGFDNGKVLAVDPSSGDTIYELIVGEARGRTELARLADVDTTVLVTDDTIYAGGFQGRVGMYEIRDGRMIWSRELSSDAGFALDRTAFYITDSTGAVHALRRRDGTPLWTQEAFHRRGLTAPALQKNYVVVGDFKGYLHWLDRNTGDVIGRSRAGSDPINSAPIVVEDTLYVLGDGGRLTAFQAEPREKG